MNGEERNYDSEQEVLEGLQLQDAETGEQQTAAANGVAEAARVPAVVIGVGGSGVTCVRRAKQLISRRVGSIPTIQYVCVDADVRSFQPGPGLGSLTEQEKCFIGGDSVGPVIDHPEEHEWLLDQIPEKIEAQQLQFPRVGEGCGQVRCVGRAVLLSSWKDVESKVAAAIKKVKELASAMNARLKLKAGAGQQVEPVIYIVGSIAGGTGSGLFLDLALMAKTLAGSRATVTAILALPEMFDEKVEGKVGQKENMRANAYAALKEIQWLQDCVPGASFEVTIPPEQNYSLGTGLAPFHLCYFVDFENSAGRFTHTEDAYELVARLLLHETATGFAAGHHSAAANLATLKRLARCPVALRPRQFSTFANTRLGFPVDAIAAYAARSTALEIVHSSILRQELGPQDQTKEVEAFVNAHDLNETGSTDQVQDHLLRDKQSKTPLVSISRLSTNFAENDPAKVFAGKVRKKRSLFDDTELSNAQACVDENTKYYAAAAGWLNEKLSEWLDTFGARGSSGLLKELGVRVKSMQAEMANENNLWSAATGKKKVEADLDEVLKKLEGAGIIDQTMGRVGPWKKQAIALFNRKVNDDLRSVARVEAIKIYEQFHGAVVTCGAAVDALIGECGKAKTTLTNALQAAQVSHTRRDGAFVLFMDIVGASYYDEFFKKHALPADKLWAEIKGRADARFFTSLLAMRERDILLSCMGKALDRYREKACSLDVIEYLRSHGEDGEIAIKLDELFRMCQPFWKIDLPQAGMQFDTHMALGCAPVQGTGDGPARFPKEIDAWIAQHIRQGQGGAGVTAATVATAAPYEIELVRYTHGARGFYFADAREWKNLYEAIRKSGGHPLHLSPSLAKASDLFPDKAKSARQAFAIAMGMGFVAKRGDYFYWNLLAQPGTVPGGEPLYDIPSDTQWATIFDGTNGRVIPTYAGSPTFRFGKKDPKAEYKLDQGREKALKAFLKKPEWATDVRQAASQYLRAVGSVVARDQWKHYAEQLDNLTSTPKGLQEQIEAERLAVLEYVNSIE